MESWSLGEEEPCWEVTPVLLPEEATATQQGLASVSGTLQGPGPSTEPRSSLSLPPWGPEGQPLSDVGVGWT